MTIRSKKKLLETHLCRLVFPYSIVTVSSEVDAVFSADLAIVRWTILIHSWAISNIVFFLQYGAIKLFN